MEKFYQYEFFNRKMMELKQKILFRLPLPVIIQKTITGYNIALGPINYQKLKRLFEQEVINGPCHFLNNTMEINSDGNTKVFTWYGEQVEQLQYDNEYHSCLIEIGGLQCNLGTSTWSPIWKLKEITHLEETFV